MRPTLIAASAAAMLVLANAAPAPAQGLSIYPYNAPYAVPQEAPPGPSLPYVGGPGGLEFGRTVEPPLNEPVGGPDTVPLAIGIAGSEADGGPGGGGGPGALGLGD